MSEHSECPSSRDASSMTPTRRQSKPKKHADPFWDLSNDVDKDTSAVFDPRANDHNADHLGSFLVDVWEQGAIRVGCKALLMLTQLIFTPIAAISFVISLFLADREQRRWRRDQHAVAPNTIWLRWLDFSPEPYQDSPGAIWNPSFSWRRRDIAKMEISKAFQLRGQVLLALAIWTVLGVLTILYATRSLYHWLSA